jgi:hypothetical protein
MAGSTTWRRIGRLAIDVFEKSPEQICVAQVTNALLDGAHL